MLTVADRSKGGSSASPAKVAAARRNGAKGGPFGKLGGRPVGSRKRSLAEFLLRRQLSKDDYPKVAEGFYRLNWRGGATSERYRFQRLFGVKFGSNIYEWENDFKTTNYIQARPARKTANAAIVKRLRRIAREWLKKEWPR